MATLDELQARIATLLKKSPRLEPLVVKKLEELVNGLEKEVAMSAAPKSPSSTLDGPTDVSLYEKLSKGFQEFKTNKYSVDPRYEKLKTGQWPKSMVVACADSRVDPSTVLGLEPGDAFTVRNVANMIPPWEKGGYPAMSSALEYAVLHLKVESIIVIGHRLCGGIKALVSQPDSGVKGSDFIHNWLEIGLAARARTKALHGAGDIDDQCKFCEKESVNVSLYNLLTFPWVKEKVSEGSLSLHGGYYDFVAGSFELWTLGVKTSQVQSL